ncbi:HNH endonuclease [bacterium]|nr:HNH endonuclease [bacterium]
MTSMHRMILGLKIGDGKITDHINRNGLNNRRCNLRIVSSSESNRNKRGYGKSKQRGVSWNEREKKWKVRVTIGSFSNKTKAARAFKRACKKLGLI